MIKLKRRYNIAIIFCLFLILIYISFPWWAAYLVKSQIQNNWQINSIKFNYPDLNSLNIETLSVSSNALKLKANNIKFSYLTKQLKIDNLIIHINSKTQPSKPFELIIPKLNFKQVFNQVAISKIDIKSLVIHSEKLASQLNHLSIELLDKSKLHFKAIANKNQYLKKTIPINAKLSYSAKHIQGEIFLNDEFFSNLHYEINNHQLNLQLKINLEKINHLISNFILKDKLTLKSPVIIDFQQNFLQKKSNPEIKISYFGTMVFKKEKKHFINAKILLTSQSENNPFTFNSSLTLFSNEKFNITKKITIEQPEINTKFKVSISPEKINIQDINSTIKIKNLYWLNEKYLIDSQLIKLKVSANEFIFEKINQTKVNLSIEKTLVKTKLIHKKINSDFLLSANIDIENIIKPKLSGNIKIHQIKIPNHYSSEVGYISFDFKKINTSFSKGEININIFDKNNKISNLYFEEITTKITTKLSKKSIHGAGVFNFNNTQSIPFNIIINHADKHLKIDIPSHNVDLTTLNFGLKNINNQPLNNFSIHSGKINHSSSINIQEKTLINSDFTIKKAVLELDKNQINDLNSKTKIHSISPLLITSTVAAKNIVLASQLNLNQIFAKIKIDNDILNLSNISMALMSGHLSAKQLLIKNKNLNPTKVIINHLSLKELIQFLDIKGLSATGNIDLNIPLKSEKQNIIIDNAHFNNKDNGIIKYQPDNTINSSDNIALKVLNNFHYKQLDGTINYNQAGQYFIKLHLVGSNPDLYSGYPVDFVLNLNGELNGAFKSLFLTGNFEEAIMQTIKAENQLE